MNTVKIIKANTADDVCPKIDGEILQFYVDVLISELEKYIEADEQTNKK